METKATMWATGKNSVCSQAHDLVTYLEEAVDEGSG